jgi:hypothetical protein
MTVIKIFILPTLLFFFSNLSAQIASKPDSLATFKQMPMTISDSSAIGKQLPVTAVDSLKINVKQSLPVVDSIKSDKKLTKPPTDSLALKKQLPNPSTLASQKLKKLSSLPSVPSADSLKSKRQPLKSDISLGLNFAMAQGNANYFNFLPQLDATVGHRLVQFTNTSQYNIGKVNGTRIDNDLDTRNYLKLNPSQQLVLEVLGFGASSKIRGLENRFTSGAGIGWKFLNLDKQKFFAAINGVYDRSEYARSDFAVSPGNRVSGNKISSFGPMFLIKSRHSLFNSPAFLTYDVSLFQSLKVSPDRRFRLQWALNFPLMRMLNFTVQSRYKNENLRLTGIKPSDFSMSAGVAVRGF